MENNINFSAWGSQSEYTGLLIFRSVAEPRNPAKFAKTWEKPRNSVEILSNTCLYNIFETYFSYWGYLLAVNLQIYLGPSSLNRANNVPKLPGLDYVAKNWALAMMLMALQLVPFFWSALLLKEQMMTSVRKTLKTGLVWSAQNRLISSEICLESNHKIGRFLPIAFWGSLPRNYREIGRFFSKFVSKNPSKFDFFFRDLSEALEYRLNQNSVDVVVQRFLFFDNFQNSLKFVTIGIS